MTNAVRFQHFSFTYEGVDKATIRDLTLTIQRGEKVIIVGRSGSGKSTLSHCLNGLAPATYRGTMMGELSIEGHLMNDESIQRHSQLVGTVLQDQDGQFVAMTVAGDVAFSLENAALPYEEMEQKVSEALDRVGMLPHAEKQPQNLSGGQKQKTSLAGLLVNMPPVLLFDEPLANLDIQAAEEAAQLIDEVHATGEHTIIIIEHRLDELFRYPIDRIIVLEDGQIYGEYTKESLLVSDVWEKLELRKPWVEAHDKAPRDWENVDDALYVDGLAFQYEGTKAPILRDISFHVKRGEFVSLIGHNGAGKSTLAQLLTGVLTPTNGVVTVGEWRNTVAAKRSWFSRRPKGPRYAPNTLLGYVMQNPNMMITKPTVLEEVMFSLHQSPLSMAEREAKAREAIATCGLSEYVNWPTYALSYGQKKRLTVASAIVTDPTVLLLDEPTAGQDYGHYAQFMSMIESCTIRGMAVICITHDFSLAVRYSDRVMLLAEGTIIADGRPSEIVGNNELLQRAHLGVWQRQEVAL